MGLNSLLLWQLAHPTPNTLHESRGACAQSTFLSVSACTKNIIKYCIRKTKGLLLVFTRSKDLFNLEYLCTSPSSFGGRQSQFRQSWRTSLVKVLTQRVDWVAWASIQFYNARNAIDDACTTSSDMRVRHWVPSLGNWGSRFMSLLQLAKSPYVTYTQHPTHTPSPTHCCS